MKRLDKLQQAVGKKVDAVLFTNDANVNYYAGTPLNSGGIFYWKFSREPVLIIADFYAKAKVKKKKGRKKDIEKIVKAKRVGYNGAMLSVNALKSLRKKTGAKFVDISKELFAIRAVKEKKEVENIKKASKYSKKALRLAENVVFSGGKESDVYAVIAEYYARKGLRNAYEPIVASGKQSLRIHPLPTTQRIKGPVIVDTGCRWDDYCSDFTKTFCKNATKKQAELLYDVGEACGFAMKEARIGMMAKDLNNAVVKFFGKKSKYQLYGLGHGVGLNIHEAPSLDSQNTEVLKENMVFTIEPGLAIPGVGGARLEFTGILTKKGFKRF